MVNIGVYIRIKLWFMSGLYWGYIRVLLGCILGLYWGLYLGLHWGLYRGYIRVILGLYWGNDGLDLYREGGDSDIV